MTDHEMLELAAKAAGYEIILDADGTLYKPQAQKRWIADPWNPLENDGDALRLAVKLYMLVDAGNPCKPAETTVLWPLGGHMGIAERHGDDSFAATRRAIVRAAAEIGRAMP